MDTKSNKWLKFEYQRLETIMRSLFYLIAVLTILSCQTKHDFDNPIPIYYDYQKGFSVDTLSLEISQDSFSRKIDSIEKIIVDLTSHSDVFLSREFIKLYENQERYINNVIVYLADQTRTIQKRTIALLAMQKKGIANNLNFLYACNHLYRKELIDSRMIFLMLFSSIDLSNRDIIKYYKSKQVRNVLLDLKTNKNTSKDFKETIDDILSGKTYKEQKIFLSNQYDIDI